MSTSLLVQFLLCPVVLLSLLLTTAPYGRHYRSGWGRVLNSRTGWFLMELPALLVLPMVVFAGINPDSITTWIPLAFWSFHYAYRTFAYPAMMRPSGSTFPILLILFAIAFNCLNGFNNGQALIDNAGEAHSWLSVHFLAGSFLFLLGFAVHFHSDQIIRNLRKPGNNDYAVPEGGWFRWVGSPQYLGEIIQWTGWAILTWSTAGLAFALFTVCNLLPRAYSNHQWYRSKFPDYPKDRKVLVPGIY